MAEAADNGGGSGGSPGGFFDVLGAVGAAQAAVGEVVTELESFTKFQQRVDQLIKDLKGSPAGPQKVAEEPLARHQFGGGPDSWREANGVFDSYQTVIKELESLSKLLSDSIEGMGIAVMASHKGYANIDVDIRDRMSAISAEAKEHYGGPYIPKLPKKTDTGGGDQDKPDHAPTDGDTGGAI
ncbi:hypothetical protein [Streptomyces sp. NPDC048527]|uniref:hypothetical protein n=1 Tax=Streptomyces sp. NPDC048527 TaxID=3365568 RepID=UPI00371A0385